MAEFAREQAGYRMEQMASIASELPADFLSLISLSDLEKLQRSRENIRSFMGNQAQETETGKLVKTFAGKLDKLYSLIPKMKEKEAEKLLEEGKEEQIEATFRTGMEELMDRYRILSGVKQIESPERVLRKQLAERSSDPVYVGEAGVKEVREMCLNALSSRVDI